MSLPEPFEWKNYNKRTGQGDPSTPMTAAKLNDWWQRVRGFVTGYTDPLVAPADGQVAGYVQGVGGETRAALNATYAPGVSAPEPSGGDDTAALNAVLAAHAGEVVALRPGRTYKVTDTIRVPSGTTLDGRGATIDATGIPAGTALGQRVAIEGVGSIGPDIAVSTAVAQWSRVITGLASTATLAAGDLILIRNEEPHTPGSTRADRDKGELNIVASVDSATDITLASGALFAYGTTGLVVQKLDPVRDVRVTGVEIVCAGVGSAHNGIRVRYGRDITIDRVTVQGAEDMGVTLNTVWNGRIGDSVIEGSTSSATLGNTGYGAAAVEGSRHITIDGNRFDNCRHFVAGGGYWPAVFIDVTDNHGTRASNYGYDCHEAAYYWRFAGNTATGCAGGFVIRGQYVTVDGNTVTDTSGRGVFCYTYDGVNEQVGLVITRNRIRSAAAGIVVDGLGAGSSVDSLKSNVTISGNVLRDIGSGTAIFLRHFANAVVNDNDVRSVAATSGIRCDGLSGTTPGTSLTLNGNTVRSVTGASSSCVRVADVTGLTMAGTSAEDATNEAITLLRCFDATVSGCRALRGRFAALRVDASGRVMVNGGVFSDSTSSTGGHGVRVTDSVSVTVNGTKTVNPRHGIYITGTDYVICTGNNAYGNLLAPTVRVDGATSQVVANNL